MPQPINIVTILKKISLKIVKVERNRHLTAKQDKNRTCFAYTKQQIIYSACSILKMKKSPNFVTFNFNTAYLRESHSFL